MSTNEDSAVEQQRQKRKRIGRIKTGIVMTISIWMLVSLIAIIVLTVTVVRLNSRVYKMELKQNSTASVQLSETESTGSGELDSVLLQDTQIQSENVIRELDSADNAYSKGDTRKVYLTFDCVPGENTAAILDTLAKYNTKATFFVVGDASGENAQIYQRIVNEGHTIAMHSFSNSYSDVYKSKDAFTNDLKQISDYISKTTGVTPKYYRFPGGSMNHISNVNMDELVKILNSDKITYFDWNVSAGDTSADYTADDVVNNVISGVQNYKTSVVLLHDDSNKSTTAEAIEPLIEALNNISAEILPIDENTYVVQYIKADTVE
ncbi:MAG: polysaccharide deacetylase family protein [Agathobacter sp.]|nr:polysaccharide deacetylase family protein [Agathobacter sp.]